MSWGFRAVTTNEFLRSRWDFTAVNGMRAGDVSGWHSAAVMSALPCGWRHCAVQQCCCHPRCNLRALARVGSQGVLSFFGML